MPTSPVDPGAGRPVLTLIDLDQPLPGQRRFISCWVSRSPGLTFVVDPGPPGTADYLVAELEKLGVEQLDFVLLTHVHLDHGGCTARILERWPGARVVCHEKGRPHLIDPARLWKGSRAVLGRKAEVYGQPAPVPADALAGIEILKPHEIRVIDTPGHAAHHQAFLHRGDLFLGESAGTFSTLGNRPDTDDYYLRPATPPRFFLEVARDSVDRLLDLDPVPANLLFAHHGRFCGDIPGLLRTARDQLTHWVETVREVVKTHQGLPHTEQDEQGTALRDAIMRKLVERDPYFARGAALPEDIQERERDFTHQTLRGMLEYLAENGS